VAKGTVGRLMKDRGYGFITTEDGKDIFFHRTALQDIKFYSLREGKSLEFENEEGPKAPRAIDIRQSEETKE